MLAESSSVNNNRPLTPESVDTEEVRSGTGDLRAETAEYKDTKKKGAFARFGERFKRR